jgi:formylglycine-generating enzyme required for sulfatase activity/predicted Ser/Thr protein kinase
MRLGGRYEIIEVLGNGGFGITYKAIDTQKPSQPVCVVKELLHQHNNTFRVDFFQKEARILEALGTHPQIPYLLAYFEENEKFYIVQEFIPGQCLDKEIIPGKRRSEDYVIKLLADVLEVLAFVHEQKVIHRDIKPHNLIRREPDGKVCLIDFGIVKEIASHIFKSNGSVKTSIMAGTFGYMPAEQVRGKTVFASDIYALGITAIQALTGLRSQDIEEDPQTAELLWQPSTQVSDKLTAFLTKMVRRHHSLRYQNAQAALEDLQKLTSFIPETIISLPVTEITPHLPQAPKKIALNQQIFIPDVKKNIADIEIESKMVIQPPSLSILKTQIFKFATAQLVLKNEFLGLKTSWKIQRIQKTAASFLEELEPGIFLELVAIPGGTFLMGSAENEIESADRSSPQHQVTIQPFLLGKYPVTQAQWQSVSKLPKIKINLNPNPSYFQGANRPVEQVSWYEAQEFCARLSQKTGKLYRLPSESEWEYACRAGTTTPFYFGNTINTDLANYHGEYVYGNGAKGIYRKETTDVGIFPANGFGLYDTHGNVWEWCRDGWYDNYIGAPTDGSAWLNESDNHPRRVLRGGSWSYRPVYCRSAYRINYPPVSRDQNHGFRVACSVQWNN